MGPFIEKTNSVKVTVIGTPVRIDLALILKGTELLTDVFFDWDEVNNSSINSQQMALVEESLENVCHSDRSTPVRLDVPLR